MTWKERFKPDTDANQGNHQLSGDEREMVRSVQSSLRAVSLAARLTIALDMNSFMYRGKKNTFYS